MGKLLLMKDPNEVEHQLTIIRCLTDYFWSQIKHSNMFKRIEGVHIKALSHTHTHSKPPYPHHPIYPISHSPLCTLTFTARVPVQLLGFFSFSVFPYTVPAVLLAPAGGSSLFLSPRREKLDVNTVRSGSSSSCTDAVFHTRSR